MKPGDRLGPYEIVEPLGAGGMGEVWLATDTRLGRRVAIKVLPAPFAADPERLARFEQEARAAAALSHPHIASVYDVGHAAGTHFIVQEYLQGQTLRGLVEAGALPLGRALTFAIQIGEALAAAHAAGIVHRDIKPENVFVTPEGHAKVLDFGLAKLTEASPAVASGPGASMSPTALGTIAGQVLGTAGYMAPEQIDGTVPVDRRADVFAFGTLLYELVSGARAFSGRSVADTLARIQHEEPVPLAQAKPALPRDLGRIVAKALAKDPAERYQHMDDLTVDLRALRRDLDRGVAESPAGPAAEAADRRGMPLRAVALAGAAGIAVGLVAAGSWLRQGAEPRDSAGEAHFVLELPDVVAELPRGTGVDLAISPDGRTITFAGMDAAGERLLYVRRLDEVGATALPGTDNAQSMVFDREGEWIAFVRDRDRIVRVQTTGGDPFSLCAGCIDPSYGDDGMLYFTDGGSLWRVSPDGGERSLVAAPLPEQGVAAMSRAEMLPGGRAVLFEVGLYERGGVAVLSLEDQRVIHVSPDGSDPFYSPSGHILFPRASTLFAVPFDLEALEVTGPAVPVLPGVRVENAGAVQAALAASGTLTYVPATGPLLTSLVRVGRDGVVQSTLARGRNYAGVALSPDGTRIAAVVNDAGRTDIWAIDVASGAQSQLTTTGDAANPVWSGDGSEILFGASGGDTFEIRRIGFATREITTEYAASGPQMPMAWTRDGNSVLLLGLLGEPSWLDLRDGSLSPVFATEGLKGTVSLSPDESCIVYETAEGVFVRELATGRELQVAGAGSIIPVWSRDSRSVLFRDSIGARTLLASIERDPELRLGGQENLFPSAPYWFGPTRVRTQDTFPDGGVLMIRQRDPEEPPDEIRVILNFTDRLH